MEFNARSDPGMKKEKEEKKKKKKEKKSSRVHPPPPIIQLNPLRRYLMGRDDVTSFWTRATNHRRFTVGCKKRRTTRRFIFFILSFSLSFFFSLARSFLFIHLARSFFFFRLCFFVSLFFLFFLIDRRRYRERETSKEEGGRGKASAEE